MKATISLDASDLLKIARLVHDEYRNNGSSQTIDYCDTTPIMLSMDISYCEDGFCVDGVKGYFLDTEIDLPRGIATQIENAL